MLCSIRPYSRLLNYSISHSILTYHLTSPSSPSSCSTSLYLFYLFYLFYLSLRLLPLTYLHRKVLPFKCFIISDILKVLPVFLGEALCVIDSQSVI